MKVSTKRTAQIRHHIINTNNLSQREIARLNNVSLNLISSFKSDIKSCEDFSDVNTDCDYGILIRNLDRCDCKGCIKWTLINLIAGSMSARQKAFVRDEKTYHSNTYCKHLNKTKHTLSGNCACRKCNHDNWVKYDNRT